MERPTRCCASVCPQTTGGDGIPSTGGLCGCNDRISLAACSSACLTGGYGGICQSIGGYVSWYGDRARKSVADPVFGRCGDSRQHLHYLVSRNASCGRFAIAAAPTIVKNSKRCRERVD